MYKNGLSHTDIILDIYHPVISLNAGVKDLQPPPQKLKGNQ